MELGMIGLGRMGGNMARADPPCRPHRRRLRPVARTAAATPTAWRTWSSKLGRAARGLGDGAGRRPDRRDDRGARRSARAGRRGRRRRQLPLHRRPDPRRGAGREEHRVHRLRRLRRRVGPDRGLRADGRRRRRGHRDAAADLRRAQAGGRVRASSTPARSAPGTSRRWSTTASSTASCRPTPRAGSCSRRPTWSPTSAATFASWQKGTVVRSWLLDLAVRALDEDQHLSKLKGYAQDSGEGRWTVEAAIDHAVPLPAITAALFARFSSRQDDSPAMKMVAALRQQFGGHAVESTGGAGDGASAAPAAGLRGCLPVRLSRPTAGSRVVHVRTLSVTDFRSYAARRARPRAGRHRAGRARTGRARPTWSRRSATSRRLAATGSRTTRRWCGWAPSGRSYAATVVRDDRDTLIEVEITPGKANRARLGGARRCRGPARCSACCVPCCSRRRTWPSSRAIRPSAGATSTTCWSPGRRGTPVCTPTTTGCSSSATPC